MQALPFLHFRQPSGGDANCQRHPSKNSREIVALGEKYDKPVVATCDVHFLNPGDEIYRRIIMFSKGFKDAGYQYATVMFVHITPN